MTVSKAICLLDDSKRYMDYLEKKIKELDSDNLADNISISQAMALDLIDVCQEYRSMLLGQNVDIHYASDRD